MQTQIVVTQICEPMHDNPFHYIDILMDDGPSL